MLGGCLMDTKMLFGLLPDPIAKRLQTLFSRHPCIPEEIRVRKGRPLEIVTGGEYGFVGMDGNWVNDPKQAYKPGEEDVRQLLDRISNHSLYALEEELRRGFIT